MKENKQTKKITKNALNFFTITKKYWKEQVIFAVLTTLSAVVNYVMDSNLTKIIENLIQKKGEMNVKLAVNFWNKNLYTFQNRNNFFW
jgi:hypothetical protein